MYNKRLDRQLQKHFGMPDKVPANLMPVFQAISNSYDHYEKDLKIPGELVDRSSNQLAEMNTTSIKEKNSIEKRRLEKIIEAERQQFRDLFLHAPSSMGILKGPNHVFELANTLYLQLIGKDNIIGKSVKDVLPEVEKQGFIELLDKVYQTGIPFAANEMLVKLDKKGNGEFVDSYLNFLYQPYRNNEGAIEGVFFFAIDVTEQVVSRKKIEDREWQYRSLFEEATDAICIADASMKFYDLNPSGCRMLGYSKEEFLGLTVTDLFPVEDLTANPFKTDDLISGKSTRSERRFKRKDGVLVDVEVSGKIMEDGRFIVFGRDISERKRTEEALSNNELRFRTLTESAPVGIFQTDIDGKTTYVNESWLEYTGMTYEETMGDGWIAAIHPSDREIMIEEWNQRSRLGIESATEYRLINKNGKIMWVMGRAVPVFNKKGIIVGHIGTVADVTERKLAIESLQQSETKYRQIVETAQEGIWLIDENNYTVFANKKMAEMLEFSLEEMLGKQNYSFMDEEWKKKASGHIERRKLGINETHDFKYITKSGKEFWASLSTNPVFDDAGIYRGALAMVTDITQRKLDEELLRQSKIILAVKNKELEQKNKELEEFAYVASHDLQEPLRTTSSFAELLQQQYDGKLDGKADKFLTYIVQSTDRMKVLINDLLDYSRLGNKRKLQQVDCNTVFQEVLDDLGKTIKDTQAVIYAGQLPIINGYRTEIKQLFQNLVINAIKFCKKDTIPQVNISASKDETSWTFAVRDKGIGIADAHKDRIFVIFQRLHTRTEYEGSGIGLAYCKKIVSLHGGKIWVESTPGEGATFLFNIPQNIN